MITFLALTLIILFITGVVTARRNARAIRLARTEVQQRGLAGRIPILMPVCGRPQYLGQVLAALARARDIDQTLLVISQDGRHPEVSALIDAVDCTEAVVIRHTRPFLGIFTYFWDSLHAASVNIRFLLDFAFGEFAAPYAIVLEDDLVPAPDFVRYFAWAARHVLADERVLSVTGFNLHSRIDAGQNYDPRQHPYDLIENREGDRPKFTGWSWAITGAMWRRIEKGWSRLSWDIALDATQRRLGLVSYKPALARVRNIGMQGGINFTESDENPKWTGLTIAEEVCPYDQAPHLLAADPALPPFQDLMPVGQVVNERRRTRGRRLWLLALAATLAACEAVLLGGCFR